MGVSITPTKKAAGNIMKETWEVVKNNTQYYVTLLPKRQIVVGMVPNSFYPGASAGGCSWRQFMRGQYQEVIFRDLGEPALKEIHAEINKRLGWQVAYYPPPTTPRQLLLWTAKSFPLTKTKDTKARTEDTRLVWNETMKKLGNRLVNLIRGQLTAGANIKRFNYSKKSLQYLDQFLEKRILGRAGRSQDNEEVIIPAVLGYFFTTYKKIYPESILVPGASYKEFKIKNKKGAKPVCPYLIARQAIVDGEKLSQK